MKIKVGDIVKCIDNEYYTQDLTLSKRYKVLKITDILIFVTNDYGRKYGFYNRRFILEKEKIVKPFGIVKFCKEMYV
jgi:hypothetical protein